MLTRAAVVLSLGLIGCDGQILSRASTERAPTVDRPAPIDEPMGQAIDPTPTDPNPFACSSDEAPTSQDARRLSRAEYLNALQGLFARALGTTDTQTLLQRLDVEARVPAAAGGLFSTADSQFTGFHSSEFFAIADGLATATSTNENYDRFVRAFIGYAPGSCALTNTDLLSDACEDALIRNLVLRAWGRPADETTRDLNDELASLRRAFALAPNSRAGVEALVFTVLLSPQFLFHLHLGVRDQQADVVTLSSHTIARKLAFTFTQSLPDETLLSMAGAQDLNEDAAYERAVAHVAARSTETTGRFAREWLHLDALPAFTDATHPKAIRVRQGITANDTLQRAMRDEVLELVRWVTANDGTLSDLLTTDISFARQPDLLRIYGQGQPAPAAVTQQNAVRFRPGERSGLLTRAAMLLAGGHSEDPIHRAMNVRSTLLCLSTPAPVGLPADALQPPAPSPDFTTRQRYEHKTSVQPCQGCHSVINPFGFAFSSYNALGAYQTHEPVYDESWSARGELPVDARVDLRPVGIDREVNGAVELSSALASSSDLRTCLTRNLDAYLGQAHRLPTDSQSCRMKRMYDALAAGRPLKEFFTTSAMSRQFRQRTIRSAP